MDSSIRFLSKKVATSWKGIAACFIMVGHLLPSSTPSWIQFFFMGNLWVGLFFFYSGYGLQLSINTKKDYLHGFLKKKIFDIYLPFVFAELVYYLAGGGYKENHYILDILLYATGLKLSNSVLWYVVEILIIYCLFVFIYRVFKKNSIVIWYIMYILFVCISVYFDFGTWWYISTFCFLIGLQFNHILNKLKNRRTQIAISILFIVLYTLNKSIPLLNISLLPIPATYIQTFLDMVLAPLFVVVCMDFSQRINVCNTITLFLGNISYEIYLYHMAFAVFVRRYCFNSVLVLVFVVIGTPLIACLINHIHESCISWRR